ncbi:MAG: restriction endonuclease subunit S [Pseudanabaena sp. ELA607]
MSKKKDSRYYSIGKLCQIIDCKNRTPPYVNSSEYLVVRTSNVRGGLLILEDIKYTTEEGFIEWTKRGIPRYGDVLFTREAPVGESCLIPPNLKICMGQRMVLFHPNNDLISPQFLSFYLITKQFRREIYQHVIGSTVTRINVDDISKIKIFCPPIAEQEKIASFLGAVDTRISQLRRKHELLQTYKRGVMQKIFSQQIRFKCDDGKPFPDWEKKRLESIFSEFKSGYNITSDELAESGSYPVFGGNGIRGYSEKFTHEGFYFLIGRQGALCGNIHRSYGKAYISEHAIACKANDTSDTEWLAQRLDYYNLNKLSESSAQPGLAVNKLLRFKLLTPCKKEQEKIANFLTAIDQKIEAVAKQIKLTEQFKKGLLQKMFV